jgi:hypothetical protein
MCATGMQAADFFADDKAVEDLVQQVGALIFGSCGALRTSCAERHADNAVHQIVPARHHSIQTGVLSPDLCNQVRATASCACPFHLEHSDDVQEHWSGEICI